MKTNHLPDLELRDELDRRLEDQAANPGVGRPWSEVKARLLTGECSRERYEAALAEVPDVEPEEYDRR